MIFVQLCGFLNGAVGAMAIFLLFGALPKLDVEEALGAGDVIGAAGSVGARSVVGGCSVVRAACSVALTEVV